MKQQILYGLPLLGAVTAWPLAMRKREVPQEHAHQNILDIVDQLLQLNNPDNIQASVFGLLGAAAAADGAGNIADADCLQQATADQAFTNAKEASDVAGMTAALIFRGLERNTGEVGLESVPCESIQAVNPEIAAIQQHQDPAADGAAELNKEITLEIARQIASIGSNPLDALEASTFAPGEIGDETAAGNTCNEEDDAAGCINSQGLRVDDASEEEIEAAVADVEKAANKNANQNEDEEAAANENADEEAADEAADEAQDAEANAKAGAQGKAGKQERQQAAAFGSCADPTIVFGTPSDGRQEDAFEAADLETFPHGSALNIAVISDFICSQLTNKCDAGEDAVATCEQASAAATGLEGQDAADAFNSALGF
ncbi:hypothetical protein K469DRAFT_616473 [Zopfia rhizophila CBS 207.26]|uniref:Uncharacterized protein n=1 Tax=Zopfia rhizophila CBS 207.26 TaxID=1314779 RepID=A0A6A6EY08_9PEZI|nr:hypothetical protein K469DRAFT_616473 [Zopfia rhizophila CBS 207.26]